MIMIDGGLIGKVIKTDDDHLIGFLYPNFPFVDSLVLLNYKNKPGIIYAGIKYLNSVEDKMLKALHAQGQVSTCLYSKEYLKETGMVFISTYSPDGKYDLDLTDRTVVLDLVYSKWGLNYAQYLDINSLEVLLEMDAHDFYDFVKPRWLSSKCCANSDNIGVFNSKAIYKLMHEPIEKAYATVLSIINKMDVRALEHSLVNFIRNAKARNYREEKQDDYNVMLKTFDYNTIGKEKEIAVILSKYRNMNHDMKIKLLWLIKQLKDLKKEMNNHDN
jgi:hypothetical protein